MEQVRFGHYISASHTYFSPEYGGIDWRRRAEIFEADEQLEPYGAMGMESIADGHTQEIHQENTEIRINEVDPDMDLISVLDPRDGKNFVIFREQDPQLFDRLHKSLGRAAIVLTSRYPLPNTVDLYLLRQSNDIERPPGE